MESKWLILSNSHALNYCSGAASLTLSWPLMVYTVCVILQGAVLQILWSSVAYQVQKQAKDKIHWKISSFGKNIFLLVLIQMAFFAW